MKMEVEEKADEDLEEGKWDWQEKTEELVVGNL